MKYEFKHETIRIYAEQLDKELADMKRRWWLMPFVSQAFMNLTMMRSLIMTLDIALSEVDEANEVKATSLVKLLDEDLFWLRQTTDVIERQNNSLLAHFGLKIEARK